MKRKILVWAVILALALTASGCGKTTGAASSASSQGESGVEMIENGGDLEIIIPDDMDSDGF